MQRNSHAWARRSLGRRGYQATLRALDLLCRVKVLLMLSTVFTFAIFLLWYSEQPGSIFRSSLSSPQLSGEDLAALYKPLPPLDACESKELADVLPVDSATATLPTMRGNRGSQPLTQADIPLLTQYSVFAAADMLLGDRRRRLSLFFADDRVMCALALLYLGNCADNTESVVACVRRVGPSNIARLMPGRCASTAVFAKLTEAVSRIDRACGVPSGRPRRMGEVSLGEVENTQMVHLGTPQRAALRNLLLREQDSSGHGGAELARRVREGAGNLTDDEEAIVRKAFSVPLKERPPFRMPQSQRCTRRGLWPDEFVNHPMGFAMISRPASVTYPANKLFEFFPINPSAAAAIAMRDDEKDAYVLVGDGRFVHEWLYATLLRYSMFAFTHKRGGWDCLRNAEIMHYGAVPVVVDLRKAPPLALSTIPRKELLEVLDEPMLSHIGYVDKTGRLYPDKGFHWWWFISSHFLGKAWREARVVDFRRPGTVNLDPYRDEHQQDVENGVASGPLSFRSPVIRRHYERFARPLWDLYGKYYSAASVVNYLLHTMKHPEPHRVLVISNSHFPSDYIHETIVTGLGELGILTDVLIATEGNKNQVLSFIDGDGQGMPLTKDTADGNYTEEGDAFPLKPFMGDPREVGIRFLERRIVHEAKNFQLAFSRWGRYNPFVTTRILGGQTLESPEVQLEVLWDAAMTRAKDRLASNAYDLVIYSVMIGEVTSIHSTQLPIFSTVRRALPPNRIAFVDHNDLYFCGQRRRPTILSGYGHIFTREHISVCPPLYEDTTPTDGSTPDSVFMPRPAGRE